MKTKKALCVLLCSVILMAGIAGITQVFAASTLESVTLDVETWSDWDEEVYPEDSTIIGWVHFSAESTFIEDGPCGAVSYHFEVINKATGWVEGIYDIAFCNPNWGELRFEEGDYTLTVTATYYDGTSSASDSKDFSIDLHTGPRTGLGQGIEYMRVVHKRIFYTQESWAKFIEGCETAEAVYNDENATPEELLRAQIPLHAGYLQLEYNALGRRARQLQSMWWFLTNWWPFRILDNRY